MEYCRILYVKELGMYVFFVLKENGLLCISLCLQKMGILYFLIIKENRNCVVNFPYVLETLIFFLYCVSGKSRYCKLCFLFNVKKNVALVVSFYVEKKNMSFVFLMLEQKSVYYIHDVDIKREYCAPIFIGIFNGISSRV